MTVLNPIDVGTGYQPFLGHYAPVSGAAYLTDWSFGGGGNSAPSFNFGGAAAPSARYFFLINDVIICNNQQYVRRFPELRAFLLDTVCQSSSRRRPSPKIILPRRI